MDDPQEAEFLTQIAAGSDPLTALAAVADEQQPKSGCFAVTLVVLVLAAFSVLA